MNTNPTITSNLKVTDSTGIVLLDVPHDGWMISGRPPIRELVRQLFARLTGR